MATKAKGPPESLLSALPQSCLVHVLTFVPFKQRLQTCAAVSTSWRAAAAAATTSIDVTLFSNQYAQAVAWLVKHGQHVTSCSISDIEVTGVPVRTRFSLCYVSAPACQLGGLRQLLLRQVAVNLEPSAYYSGWLHAAAKVTHLSLRKCQIGDSMRALTGLSGLSDLQHLVLDVQRTPSRFPLTTLEACTFPNDVWHHLTKLTHLDLSGPGSPAASVLALTCLTRLQVLLLAQQSRASTLAALQPMQQMSVLQLLRSHCLQLDRSNAPVLTQLQHLQQLALGSWEVEPQLLRSMSTLQDLQLGIPGPWMYNSKPVHQPVVLAVLADMTQLTSFSLGAVLDFKFDSHDAQASPTMYAAVTANSRLQRLSLHAKLPGAAWLHLFPAAAVRLPLLQHLSISCHFPNSGVRHVPGIAPMHASALDAMVCNCPALTSLELSWAVDPNIPLTPLCQLTGLSALSLAGVSAASAAVVVSSLTQLTQLQLGRPNSVLYLDDRLGPDFQHGHDNSVFDSYCATQLLQLTGLTRLEVLYVKLQSPWYRSPPRALSLVNEAPDCFLPDVWSQLVQQVAELSRQEEKEENSSCSCCCSSSDREEEEEESSSSEGGGPPL